MELYPRQHNFYINLSKAVKQSGRVIACSPTGTGKTVVFIHITHAAIGRGRTVLIITESRKIFSQISKRCSAIEINAKIGQHLYVQPNKVYIGMAQTLRRRPFIVDQFSKLNESLLTIYDEAHEGDATTVLRQLPQSLLLGFTATPSWENAKHLPELYKALVISGQVSDFIQEGILTPYKHYARVGAELDKLRIKGGEFTEESQKAVFESGAVFDGLLEDLRTIPYKKCMVFCSSISHCEDVFEMLQYNDISSVRYHSKHDLSEYDLYKFESGDINVCVSVCALQKGYDFNKVDLVVLLFKTTSIVRYCQSIGRGSRLAPNKPHFTVLDYGANYAKHGLWDADIAWETRWLPDAERKKKTKDTLGVAAVKYCPECMAIIPTSTQVCPYCSALLREEKELQHGDLVEITEGYSAMVGRHVSTLDANELAVYAKLKNKKAFAIRVARAMEQTNPGFLDSFAKAMNYSYRWPFHQRELIGAEKIEFADIVLK